MITQLMNNEDDVKMYLLIFSKAFAIINHRIFYENLAVIGVSPPSS